MGVQCSGYTQPAELTHPIDWQTPGGGGGAKAQPDKRSNSPDNPSLDLVRSQCPPWAGPSEQEPVRGLGDGHPDSPPSQYLQGPPNLLFCPRSFKLFNQ